MAGKGHQAAQNGHNRIVEIGNGHNGGHHGGCVALGSRAGPAELVVLLLKFPQAFRLAVEHFYHLLAGRHLLDVAVQVAQAGLLLGVIRFAPLAAEADVEEHDYVAHGCDQGKLPVQDVKDRQRAHHLNEALDHHGEAVVQRIGDRVHVVREVAHHIAVAVRVEKAQRQLLQVGKEIAPDVIEHLLRGLHHDLRVAERGERAHGIDDGRRDDAREQRLRVARGHVVHHRPDHVGADQVCQGADRHEHGHRQQQELVPPHVAQQRAHRQAEIPRLCITELSRRHRCPLLSSETRRSPGKSDRIGAATRASPRRARGHPPESQSDPLPSRR